MWKLSSQIRDGTHTPALDKSWVRSLKHSSLGKLGFSHMGSSCWSQLLECLFKAWGEDICFPLLLTWRDIPKACNCLICVFLLRWTQTLKPGRDQDSESSMSLSKLVIKWNLKGKKTFDSLWYLLIEIGHMEVLSKDALDPSGPVLLFLSWKHITSLAPCGPVAPLKGCSFGRQPSGL